MKLFQHKRETSADRVEARFQTAVDLVKDLDKTEFKRLIKGMDLAWQAYDAMRKVQTIDEKSMDDIDRIVKEVEDETTK